jgi:PPOX class probable F420-dependent enzyme
VNDLDPASRALLQSARVAHLATADQYARPHAVPIVFVLRGDRLYFPLDRKPKREDDWHMLRRVRNIETNGRVAIVVDRYDEDWTTLAWVLLEGVATIVEGGDERDAVAAQLAEKYPQYRATAPSGTAPLTGRPVVRVEIERTVRWDASDAAQSSKR